MEQVVCDERLTSKLAPLWDGIRRGERETADGSRTGTGSGSGGAGERGECEVEETGKSPQPQPQQEICVCEEDGDGQVPTEARDDPAPESNKDRIKNKCLLGNWLEEVLNLEKGADVQLPKPLFYSQQLKQLISPFIVLSLNHHLSSSAWFCYLPV